MAMRMPHTVRYTAVHVRGAGMSDSLARRLMDSLHMAWLQANPQASSSPWSMAQDMHAMLHPLPV